MRPGLAAFVQGELAMKLGLIAVAALCASAQADIYFEVTRAGEAANGLWDQATMGEAGLFDLRVWTDTPGDILWAAAFDIAGTPTSPGNEWIVDALGIPDPDGLLPQLALAGTLVNGGIVDAMVGVFPGLPPLELPVGPENSALIYAGFAAHNTEVGGRLFALPTQVESQPGGLNAVSIGIMQSPAPMSLAVLVPFVGLTGRRRRTLA
jgi:hypothetical protein